MNEILGQLVSRKTGYLQFQDQVAAWREQLTGLRLLAQQLLAMRPEAESWRLLLEFTIPHRNRRPDAVLLGPGAVFVLEFKVGEREFKTTDKWQVRHYALDLRDFHLPSQQLPIHAILVATAYRGAAKTTRVDGCEVLCSGMDGLAEEVLRRAPKEEPPIPWEAWAKGSYRPALSIVEAAESLYLHHDVAAINHNQADNLTVTTSKIQEILADAERRKRRAICFVTGVPGAGKTLVGLAAVHDQKIRQGGEPKGVFLSGNSPLVAVVRAAISKSARHLHRREASRTVETFIANVHRFIDETSAEGQVPPVHAIVFDEAQRAWSADHMRKKKRGTYSEPELLLDIMSRKPGWSVIVALIGGGQEINDGEAGLEAWGEALEARADEWDVWVPPQVLHGDVAIAGHHLFPGAHPTQHVLYQARELHLQVGLRSPRALHYTQWVEAVLQGRPIEARRVAAQMEEFPLMLTRSVDLARWWLRARADPQQRIGFVASSGHRRLRTYGVQLSTRHGQNTDAENWFLAPTGDIRSSNALEVAAIEFECQGLELDWIGVCWGDDFTRSGMGWDARHFAGTSWRSLNKFVDQAYVLNTYRVLLTRARQGMVIFVPKGDPLDPTRDPARLESTFRYLLECGAKSLEDEFPGEVGVSTAGDP